MEDMREMVAALRNLRLKGASEVLKRLCELQKKATKQAELVAREHPRDGKRGPELSPTGGSYAVSATLSPANVVSGGRHLLVPTPTQGE